MSTRCGASILAICSVLPFLQPALRAAQALPTDTFEVKLEVRTRDGRQRYRIGETIPLELRFSSSVAGKYRLSMRNYDRSGRLNEETFTVRPNSGWKDPLAAYYSVSAFIRGGLGTEKMLSAEPVALPIELNEWVRFDQPGDYRVTLTSQRVNEVSVVSNEVPLTIVAATPEWQQETLQRALAVLASTAPPVRPGVGESSERREAFKTLRYLGTADAAREMAHRVDELDCSLGLAGSPARAAGLEEMKKLLHDPNTAIDNQFFFTMSVLALPDGPGPSFEELRKIEAGFRAEVAAAQIRQGSGSAVSAMTLLVGDATLPPEQRRRLTDTLVAGFDTLTAQQQMELMRFRTKSLDPQSLLPLLRKVAQRYQDFPAMREMNAYMWNEASGAALEQWYKARPEEARPAVLQEILRPKPRFGAAVLGVLPDRELTDAEQTLLAHLRQTSDLDALGNLATLIHRYAGAAVEPEVVAYLDEHLGRSACAVQEPLLAWLLKFDPANARPRLAKVMAARGNTGCYTFLLEHVGQLENSPILHDLALKGLDDPDPQVVGDAAVYLRYSGLPADEELLWTRFTAWSRQWTGREAEFSSRPLPNREAVAQAGAGQKMMEALAAGQGWLASERDLQRLVALAVGLSERQQAEQYLKTWQTKPWTLAFEPGGTFRIVQYSERSMEGAKQKLAQFPKGSIFRWVAIGPAGSAAALAELSAFAADHGLVIEH